MLASRQPAGMVMGMARRCDQVSSAKNADGQILGKITTGGKGHPGLLDAQGRPVDLRRSHILSGCGPDGTPLDPEMPVTIGVKGERRVSTVAEVAEQYFKLSRAQQQARALFPRASAGRIRAIEAARFPGQAPATLNQGAFLGVKSMAELLARVDPERLLRGDDTAAMKRALRDFAVPQEWVDAAFRDEYRYVAVMCPGVSGTLHDYGPQDTIRWEAAGPGAPGALVSDTEDVGGALVGFATIVIGELDGVPGEQVLDIHPGFPTAGMSTCIKDELTQRGYQHGDTIPYEMLRELGVSHVQLGPVQAVIPATPSALTLPERAREAMRYAAWLSNAGIEFQRYGGWFDHEAGDWQLANEVYYPLRKEWRYRRDEDGGQEDWDTPGPERSVPERIAWVTYGAVEDVRETVDDEGTPYWELDGVRFRTADNEYTLLAWAPELETWTDGSSPSVRVEGQWYPINSLEHLEWGENLDARLNDRHPGACVLFCECRWGGAVSRELFKAAGRAHPERELAGELPAAPAPPAPPVAKPRLWE